VLVPVPVVATAPGLRVNVQVPEAGKLLKTTLPVAKVHVGCVIVPIVGVVGKGLIVATTAFLGVINAPIVASA
jgi:hypothetical protein